MEFLKLVSCDDVPVAWRQLTRSRLTEQPATTMKVNFRSWRDTGITWLALAGVDVATMQRRGRPRG
jgi:hypothetical protein